MTGRYPIPDAALDADTRARRFDIEAAITPILCKRADWLIREHGRLPRGGCDGRMVICGWCRKTARQIAEAIMEGRADG